MNSTLLTKKIDTKTIVWFQATNKYVILENNAASIVQDITNHISLEDIAMQQSKELNIPFENIVEFIKDLKQDLYDPNTKETESLTTNFNNVSIPSDFKFIKYYEINNYIFKVAFKSEENLFFIHPKFAHLEVDENLNVNFNYQVFSEKELTYFVVENNIVGSWEKSNIHYFQGTFSMQVVKDMHQKEENDWLGVFHASAVSDNKKSILLLGDSGNGKSTSLALLQANGFNCLADDFVPIDCQKKEVYSFPSAISIKKNSLECLLPIYPELENSAEYHFKSLNKIVRFLVPQNSGGKKHLPCKALVFIKYKKGSDLIIKPISRIEAFEKLVPDSWLSPIPKNANTFLNWFSDLPCYKLIYSDNDKMISTVTKIFKNDFLIKSKEIG
jgi:hypothetical protein